MKSLLKARYLQSPWCIALILLSIFFITTSYKYGWDDQHLEIPLLKHLIDPSLFTGDYYVESLTQNFATFFYPILAKLIRVDQIPAVYFILYIISRYFLFFFSYKLWLHLAGGERFKALYGVLTFILITRVDEFLYRTFSHQELALAIIVGGIYYFFKERFIISALLLGLAANFHGLYSFFPMFYIGLYLLWQIRKHGVLMLIKTCATFIVAALPFLIWIIKNRMSRTMTSFDPHDANWLSLFITACPQNFFYPKSPLIPLKTMLSDFKIFLSLNQTYLYLVSLFILNIFFNEPFRKNKKALAFCIGGFGLLGMCLTFTYFYHNRLAIDLNLIRNTQFLLFLLSGFTSILIVDTVIKRNIATGLIILLSFALFKLGSQMAMLGIALMMSILAFHQSLGLKNRALKYSLITILLTLMAALAWGVGQLFQTFQVGKSLQWILIALPAILVAYACTFFVLKKRLTPDYKKLFLLIPMILFLIQFGIYHRHKLKEETTGDGFWRLQRNWEDMQRHTKDLTPKDAMVLIPYNMEMCGFRILSERKVVVSTRDHGIIGFDYGAAMEWRTRIVDVEEFKFIVKDFPLRAVKNAIEKYHANYIVFMNNVTPSDNPILKRLYSNEFYSLYKVLVVP